MRAKRRHAQRRQAKPRARARGKAKRTKYLSLSELMVKAQAGASSRSPWAEEEEEEAKPEEDACGDDQHHHHEASSLFEALPPPSLSDILGPSPPASPDGAGGSGALPGAEEEDLPRRALRGRERWVYCSGGPSPSPSPSPAATPCSSAASTGASPRSLLLKLDYEEILAAWAGRGSLYIGSHPDLADVEVLVEPQPPSGRAERVRRYKEKRRRRLFARRVRYEVRRINAVRRPRFKGRFIKEEEESELRPA